MPGLPLIKIDSFDAKYEDFTNMLKKNPLNVETQNLPPAQQRRLSLAKVSCLTMMDIKQHQNKNPGAAGNGGENSDITETSDEDEKTNSSFTSQQIESVLEDNKSEDEDDEKRKLINKDYMNLLKRRSSLR